MQHLARCLLCLPGKQTNPLHCRAARDVWRSCRVSHQRCPSVLDVAHCRSSPRAFLRTRRCVVRPSLLLKRNWKYGRSSTALEFKRNKRDRDAIFATLRSYLLRPGTPATVVVSLLRQHFLETRAFTISNLSRSERAVLVEILHKVLEEWSLWKEASSTRYVSPARLTGFFARYGILEPQDWAFCLNSLAWTAYDAFSSDLDKAIDKSLQRSVETFPLLRALLKTWKLFFYCHSAETHDIYELFNTDPPGLWPFLQKRSVPAGLGDSSAEFSHRLLCFAPGWRSDGESLANQQLICASLVSIVALLQSVENSTSISILSPSAAINWETSSVSASRLGEDGTGMTDSVQHSQNAPSGLTSDELSVLFIVGQALNSQTINLTMLRVSLARIVPENQISQIMMAFSQFRLRLPGLLGHATSDQQYTVDLEVPDFVKPRDSTSRITKPVRRGPIDTLLERLQVSRNISEVESVIQVFSSLKQRNPRLRRRDFDIAAYKKYLDFGTPDQERHVWNASPGIHDERDLCASRLEFYFQRNDVAGFEDVWARLTAANYAVSAADWCRKLQLYFNCGRLGAALDRFHALLRLSGRSQHNNSSVVRSRDSRLVTIDTFNLMIQNLLHYNRLSWAVTVKKHLDGQQDIKANVTTYNLFFSYYIDRGETKPARRYLLPLTEVSPPAEFAPHFKFIRHYLQQWPRNAPWTDIHGVMKVFDRVLGDKYFTSNVLRKISLIPLMDEISFHITVSPVPGSDSLEGETKSMNADSLSVQIPMRAHIRLPQVMEALRTDLLSLMSAIADGYPSPKNARLMLILWTYCILQGIPNLQEIQERLNKTLLQLPVRQQMRILGGDLYKRLSHYNYWNFAYVRDHFGPSFAVRRLNALGLGEYGPMIRKLPWRGFATYDDQQLLDVGMTSERARSLFLDDIASMYNDLKVIRQQEKSRTRRRVVTKEGIWYLRYETVDQSGSLRKIPFEYWEAEPRRQATERFKLATATPRLLGGDEALRRSKQRMLFKGRKVLTRVRKGLFYRPLRDKALRHLRVRKGRTALDRWNTFERRTQSKTQFGDGLLSEHESGMQVPKMVDKSSPT